MPTPTPTAETYTPCISLSASLGGVDGKCTAGGIKLSTTTDDMTNNKGGGWEEDVQTSKVAEFNLTMAWDGPTGLVNGNIYPLLINVATMPADLTAALTPVVANSPAFAGLVRIATSDAPFLNVKTGFKLSFTGKSQGLCAVSL